MIHLHHYPESLFSEKIRVMLGHLGLAWASVEIPSIMPRPLLMPLSGGYRKTPCLQIGANVYCDTAVIARGLDRHVGGSGLFAPGFAALRFAEWADSHLFRVTVALNFAPENVAALMASRSPEEVAAFAKDRAELSKGAPVVQLETDVARGYLAAYLDDLERTLESPFLFGEAPCIADFSLYHNLWFLEHHPTNAKLLEPYGNVGAFLRRVASFGYGEVSESDGEAALADARGSEPVLPELPEEPPQGVALGQTVAVTPADYGRIPVTGRLVACSAQEIVLEREAPEVGHVMTHFPSAGFQIAAV